MTTEQELRLTLAQHAAEVEPEPDPYARLMGRRARRRRIRGSTGIVVAVVLAAALPVGANRLLDARGSPGSSPSASASPSPDARPSASPSDTPSPTDGSSAAPPANGGQMPPIGLPKATVTRQVLDSPTRGSLAGDHAYVEALRRAVARMGIVGRDPAALRVLFVGDVGRIRIAVVSATTGRPPNAVLIYGEPGDTAEQMARQAMSTYPLEPVMELSPPNGQPSAADEQPSWIYLILGPTTYTVEISTRVSRLPDGKFAYIDWRAEPTPGFFLRTDDDLPPRVRIRFRLGSRQLYSRTYGYPFWQTEPAVVGWR